MNDVLGLVRCVEYQNMTFYILICSLHHCLIQIKVIVFVPRGNVLFHFLGQTVEACCGNVHLLDPERDGLLEVRICDTAAAVKHQRDIYFIVDLLQYVKGQFGSYRVISVCVSDRHGKGVNTCLLCKYFCIIRVRAADSVVAASVFTSPNKPQLCFYRRAVFATNSTTFLVFAIFSSKGSVEASSITDVNPSSKALCTVSKVRP